MATHVYLLNHTKELYFHLGKECSSNGIGFYSNATPMEIVEIFGNPQWDDVARDSTHNMDFLETFKEYIPEDRNL